MSDELTEVHLIDLPVQLHFRTVQQIDEVQRELLYIASEPGTVPVRLRELSHHITTRFGPFAGGPRNELLAALAAGHERVHVTYRMPREVGAAARAANDMLDEVDEFCRSGGMLALAAPDEVWSYRRWFLSQFALQIDGAAPCPWPAWADGGSPRAPA